MIIKTTKSGKLIKQIADLKKFIMRRAENERSEKELKRYFKLRLGIGPTTMPADDIALRAGVNTLLIERRSRSGLDPEKLKKKFGVEDLSDCYSDTPYVEISVTSLSAYDPAQTKEKRAA